MVCTDDDTFSLLDRLLEDLPEVVERFVLPALDATALALLARVGRGWRTVVVSSGLRCAGITEGVPLTVTEFCGSVERLAWAKANGCPWNEWTCALAARGGHVEVLKWAREHDCPWNASTCTYAAQGRGVLRDCRATRVGESERLPVEREDVCFGRSGRAD